MRKFTAQNSFNETLEFQDTIQSLFGEQEHRNHESLKGDARYNQFRVKLRELQGVAINKGVDVGEALLLINIKYGFVWDTIPFGRFSEVKDYLSNNIDRRFEILTRRKP